LSAVAAPGVLRRSNVKQRGIRNDVRPHIMRKAERLARAHQVQGQGTSRLCLRVKQAREVPSSGPVRRPLSGHKQRRRYRHPGIPARARRQLCAAAHNRLYVHRPIMCSGGVVIGVSPAMRPRGRCTAEHNRQLREDHRGRQRCEMQARPAGYCQAISQPVFGADALGFHEPVARIAVGGRPSPIDPRWPGYRRIDASPACSASRRLCAAVSAPKDALSRGNEFRSEPVVHNRTLNIEAVMRSCA